MASANLDFLRSVAVLCVLLAHLVNYIHPAASWTWNLGQLGVLIFFVHTSLVLMMSLDRDNDTLGFYVRRVFRIYPLAIVCILIAQAVHPRSPVSLISNLALTNNLLNEKPMYGVLWSLPIEVQMYALLPMLFWLLRGRGVSVAITCFIAAIPIAMLQPAMGDRLAVIAFLPCFMGGLVAWQLGKSQMRKLHGALWPIGIAAASVVWMIENREYELYYRWAFCLVLGLAIPLFREMQFGVSASQTIAKYSYGVYLSHTPIIAIAFDTLWKGGAMWLVFFLALVIVPVVMFHLIEEPMIRLGRRAAIAITGAPRSRPQPALSRVPSRSVVSVS